MTQEEVDPLNLPDSPTIIPKEKKEIRGNEEFKAISRDNISLTNQVREDYSPGSGNKFYQERASQATQSSDWFEVQKVTPSNKIE